jgi:hypothetical protein
MKIECKQVLKMSSDEKEGINSLTVQMTVGLRGGWVQLWMRCQRAKPR